jgi:predicted RNA-binding Zn-ribbon protein involved in translation (DUF1610 family)
MPLRVRPPPDAHAIRSYHVATIAGAQMSRLESITCPGCGVEFARGDVPPNHLCPVCGAHLFGTKTTASGAAIHPPPSFDRHISDSRSAQAFVNPANGHVERIGSAWAWCLVFGPIYFAVKGVWGHAALSLVLALATGGVSMLIYPFFAAKAVRSHYLRHGWQSARE